MNEKKETINNLIDIIKFKENEIKEMKKNNFHIIYLYENKRNFNYEIDYFNNINEFKKTIFYNNYLYLRNYIYKIKEIHLYKNKLRIYFKNENRNNKYYDIKIININININKNDLIKFLLDLKKLTNLNIYYYNENLKEYTI